MATTTVQAPGNEAHFMHVKPVSTRVRVRRGEHVLAESGNAIRVMETGREPYDPMIYIPQSDVSGELATVDGKTTHCPLKGDASYFTLDGEEIAWTYDRPLEGSGMLKDHVAFYPNKVTLEEIGADT
ncbi:MAG: DUF427 domain-containing protein [Rhizobiaceae bacterium]|nr:DUF427 domain-containing protein [Rhizobiaceae bacterium]